MRRTRGQRSPTNRIHKRRLGYTSVSELGTGTRNKTREGSKKNLTRRQQRPKAMDTSIGSSACRPATLTVDVDLHAVVERVEHGGVARLARAGRRRGTVSGRVA